MSSKSDPAIGATAITPSDTAELDMNMKGIYVGGAGNIKLETADGSTVTFASCAAGSILPVVAKFVFSTDTTATALIALY